MHGLVSATVGCRSIMFSDSLRPRCKPLICFHQVLTTALDQTSSREMSSRENWATEHLTTRLSGNFARGHKTDPVGHIGM